MRRLYLLFVLLFVATLHSFSQDNKAMDTAVKTRDSITLAGTGMSGIRFFRHGANLNMDRLTEILKPNPEATAYLKKAKTNGGFATFFSIVGGFAIGWELGSSLGGKSINWGVMGGGLGAVGLTIPFAIGTKQNALKAVRIYNASL
jgi:hypothetical protein